MTRRDDEQPSSGGAAAPEAAPAGAPEPRPAEAPDPDLRRLRRDFEQSEARVLKTVREETRDLKRGLRRLQRTIDRELTLDDRQRAHERALRRHLRRMASTSRPIVVGPWTGEVGFELLYWIPFVRWAVSSFGIDPGRLVAVSRGGPVSWYGGLHAAYHDVLDLVDPGTLRSGAEEFRKQAVVTPVDRRLVRTLRARLGRFHLLHPSLMYQSFWRVWRHGESPETLRALTLPQRIDAAPPDAGMSLPDRYVAMKWYFSTSLPESPDNRAFVDRLVAAVAARTPVVLLTTGLEIDDHVEHLGRSHPNVRLMAPAVEPARNLEVQTRVLARATAFVGTYGGFSYLAPLVGVPSVALFANHAGFNRRHLDFAQDVFARIGAASFVPLSLDDAGLLPMLLPAAGGPGEAR